MGTQCMCSNVCVCTAVCMIDFIAAVDSVDAQCDFLCIYLPAFFFITFFTIFCSSIKKARTIRDRVHFMHREPP